MTKHNKSLGKSSTNAPALNTGISTSKPKVSQTALTLSDIERMGGLSLMKERIEGMISYLSDPTKRVPQHIGVFVNKAIATYERAVKASIGMPTYSDSVTRQAEAPVDIPTIPLEGYQLLQRTCLVNKLASSGTTAGGFYATLKASDLQPYTKNAYYRIRKITSWTGTIGSNVGSQFAGVQVPVGTASGGTEVMPIWSENWTPIGRGFAGIVTEFPLGDFPQFSTGDSNEILSHFTALGGAGGVTGVPVIFHVEIECLV